MNNCRIYFEVFPLLQAAAIVSGKQTESSDKRTVEDYNLIKLS